MQSFRDGRLALSLPLRTDSKIEIITPRLHLDESSKVPWGIPTTPTQ
jgi:hypothetical protein